MDSVMRYELLALRRTKKLIVLPVVFALLSMLSAFTSKYMNQLLAGLMTDDGITIILPDPVLVDSYITYTSDLFEIVLFIVMFLAVAAFIGDKTRGILPLLLSKPIAPWQYLLGKYVVFNGLILMSLVVGHLLFTYYTHVLYDGVLLTSGLRIVLMYLVYVVFISAVALVASTWLSSYVTALMTTVGVFFVGLLLDVFHRFVLFRYLPGGISRQLATFLQDGTATDLLATAIVTLVLSSGLILLAVLRLRTQDLT